MKIGAQFVKEVSYKLLIAKKGHFEKTFMLKNNARVFLQLVDFRKCEEYMSNINLFRNLHKNKMNSKCNLWEMNL
jgi:N-acetylglutamate synthase-like GNAT family acetyltransferase